MRKTILGVPIDFMTVMEARDRLKKMISDGRFHLVTTPNPEMLVLAARDARFRDILSRADLAVCDGKGLALAASWRGVRKPVRLTGVDLVSVLANICAQEGRSLYLLGAAEGVAAAAAAALKREFPALVISGTDSGGRVSFDASGHLVIAASGLERIAARRPDVLLVAFGHGAQEKWIADNIHGLPSVRLAVGVGGTFDFLAGKIRRAPWIFRRLGLEWAWRLCREPWRWRRIWNAVAVFPYLVLTEKH